jgi:hypothetical protein
VIHPRLPGDKSDPLLRGIGAYWHDIERLASPQQRERLLGLAEAATGPHPAEARAALADELIDLLPADHPLIRALRVGVLYSRSIPEAALGPAGSPVNRPPDAVGTIPVTIYVTDEHVHEQVEDALEAVLATAGLQILARGDPVIGSWFRQMSASPGGEDPGVTARLLQSLPPLLSALQPTRDAVIRTGAVLVVKLDWTVSVFELTPAQQAHLDQSPHLARSPDEIIAALSLAAEDQPGQQPDPGLVLDLYVEDQFLGKDSRFLRETGVSFGRPRVSPVPDDELTVDELRRGGLAGLRLSKIILPFDLEEPPDGCRYLETTVRMAFDSHDVESLQLALPSVGPDGPRWPDDSVLDTRGVGRELLTWKLSARHEQLGLRPTGREVLAVLASPQESERLTGTLDANVCFTRRVLGRDRKSTAEPLSPLRFTLNVVNGSFEAGPDPSAALVQ